MSSRARSASKGDDISAHRVVAGLLTEPQARPKASVVDSSIEILGDCVAVCRSDGRISFVNWSDIREIVTYKLDLFGCDEICIAFRVGPLDEWHELSESDRGFDSLTRMLSNRFPTIPSDWPHEVMFPPFVANERTLFRSDEMEQGASR